MRTLRSFSLVAAFAAALAVAPATQAANVSYIALGEFTYDNGGGPVTSTTYDNGQGAIINFVGEPTNELDLFPSNVSFGSFSTTGTTGDPTPVSGTFRLTIIQSDPFADVLIFDAVLSGVLGQGGGTLAFIDFTTLTRVSTQGLQSVTYDITNATDLIPGRLSIAAPSAGAVTRIEGRVDYVAVPEPTSIVLAGLAAPLFLIARARRSAAKA